MHRTGTMLVDCCRFAAVQQYQDILRHMSEDWRRHFDRYEWLGSIELTTNHIRVSDKFRHDAVPAYSPSSDPHELSLVVPHQALSVNGWSDPIAAKVFVEALNVYAEENWASSSSKIAMVVSPFDPYASAQQIRKRGSAGRIGAVAMPLLPTMLGSGHWDPVYDACQELGLPVLIHYSGVEGSYTGAPPLSGAPHTNPLSRLILMPHLAESNLASLLFEGTFYRFPELRLLFAGFGFKWVPSLLRRMDQEWRNFRSDMPWIREKPSTKFLSNVWVSSYPVGEAVNPAQWIGEYSAAMLERIVYSSHAPFETDRIEDVEAVLGAAWVERLMRNGEAFLSLRSKVGA
jgi:uncharacterized protein